MKNKPSQVGTDATGDVFEKEISVIVESAPEISDFSSGEYIITVGKEFALECAASGNPEPDMTWTRKTSDGDVTFRNGPLLDFEVN